MLQTKVKWADPVNHSVYCELWDTTLPISTSTRISRRFLEGVSPGGIVVVVVVVALVVGGGAAVGSAACGFPGGCRFGGR